MKSIIHVNRHHIKENSDHGTNKPVFTIKRGGKTIYASSVKINGPSEMVYDKKGLSCGAKAYIVTNSELELENQISFKEIKNE